MPAMHHNTRFVRVRIGNTETTVSAGYARQVGLTPLDKPALDKNGRPLRDKPVLNARAPKRPRTRSGDEATTGHATITEANKEATA